MNIRCYMIKKNREVEVIMNSPSKQHFRFNNGLYTINKEAVSLAVQSDDKTEMPVPELIYTEGNPLPLTLKEGSVTEFLEKIVISNALKQVAKADTGIMLVIVDYLKHPTKIMLLIFVLIIAGSIVMGLIGV